MPALKPATSGQKPLTDCGQNRTLTTVYSEVLVVNKNCVYKKGNSYYVRVLDENGYYINEQEVKVSLETEEYMAISGVEEGTICDSGYKAFIRQEDGNGG